VTYQELEKPLTEDFKNTDIQKKIISITDGTKNTIDKLKSFEKDLPNVAIQFKKIVQFLINSIAKHNNI